MSDTKRTETEIRSFVELAIAERFNTNAPSLGYLSLKGQGLRSKEQAQLAQRKMRQRVTVNKIQITDGTITIDADRLISVREIRSAFRFPLTAKLATTSRTKANPYGLRLESVSPIEKKGTKK